MSPTLFSTLALLFVSYTQNVNASWRMRGSNMITARIDPLISPGGVASHVHNVVGGSNFAATYDYNTLRQSSCSSVEVQEDKSNYWAPGLYYKHRDTGKFELVPATGWGIYYFHRGKEPHVQFPEGFRMIAGSANKTGRNSTDDDGFRFHCLTKNAQTDPPESLELPKQACPNGIRIQVMFPACWNGKDATSANFKDHVSFPVGSFETGDCPPTHPKRFMSVFLEQFAETDKFEYYDGAFSLSTGDNVGYSNHADFTNGWDASPNSLLQQAIDTCTDPGANIDACEVFKPYRSEVFNVCHAVTELPVEDVGIYGGLDKLPGDNPIWGGNVPKKLTGVSNNPPWGSGVSTLPDGWVYHGCIDEGNPGATSLNGDRFTDPSMNVALCVDRCDKEGYTLAGLENGQDCGCASEFTQGGTQNLIDPWACSAICPGNLYENCGNSRKINLYTKTGGPNPPSKYPAVGSQFTEVFTNDGTSSPSPVAGSGMNNNTLIETPPPSNSTLSMNGSMTPTSAAPPTTTSSTTTPPSVAPAVSTPPTTTPPSVAPAAATPPTTTSPSVAPAVDTPPATSPAATLPVCHTPKMVKRVPSFLKREPLESFHVPARHRRRQH